MAIFLTCAMIFSITVGVLGPPRTALAQTNNGMALWLKFDEAAGVTTFVNASGNNANGACVGAACPTAGVAGRVGQAVQFDGANNKVQVALNVPAGSFSLAAWVRYTGTTWDGGRTILEFGDDAPFFGVNQNGQLTVRNVAAGGMVPLGQWTHVAYVWNGTESRLYVNGQAVQANAVAPVVTGQGLGIGAEIGGPAPWLGQIDEVRVYNKALAAAEVGELANPEGGPAAVPPPPPTDAGNARLIDLTVSIYKPVTSAADRKPYEDLFNLFADTIFEMTNGAHKIRNITIYDNGRFADRADIRWIEFEQQPRASTNGYGKGQGVVNMGDAIFDQQTVITNPDQMPTFVQTLAHEWGHYFYGMMDEYEGTEQSTDVSSPRPGDTPPTPCSVMCAAGGALDFANLNFSTRKSTTLAGRTQTANYRTYGVSGWETVARPPADDPQAVRGSRLYWPDLARVAPGASADASLELPASQTAARNALKINWTDVAVTARKYRMLLVDVSNDMGGDNKLASAKVALKGYVDGAKDGDMIGIITFADTHTVVQPLTVIAGAATKDAIKAKIDGLAAKTGVVDRLFDSADQAALDALKNAPDFGLITDRGIYTIIDGAFTDTTEPHIFQKVYNAHNAAGIPISIYNYAAQNKPNDLLGNAFELMQFSTTAAQPPGAYQFVGAGGFTLPTAAMRGVGTSAGTAAATKLLDALDSTDQRYSPIVDVDLGATKDVTVQVNVPLTGAILVDGTLDNLEVTVSHSGLPAGAQVTLVAPDGSPISGGKIYSDGVETLCVFTVVAPMAGRWQVQVAAVGAPIVATHEETGYANDGSTIHALLTAVGGSIVDYPEEVVLVASLSAEEAIARAQVTAWVEQPDGTVTDITFTDDGIAPDAHADDGQYTALLPYGAPGDYNVTAVFDNNAGEAVFTQEGLADGATTATPVSTNFVRTATLQILVQDHAEDDHGSTNSNASDLLPNNEDQPGRIDQAGDLDRFRVTSPVPGSNQGMMLTSGQSGPLAATATTRFALRLTHFALGMNATVVVTTSGGTRSYNTGALGYNQYWSLPLDLAPDEVVYVTVLHQNAQAATGSYDISFGKPLFGEFAGRTVHLPLILR